MRWRRVAVALATVAISGCSLFLTFDGFGDCQDDACVAETAPPDEGDGGPGRDAALVCSPLKWPGPPATDTSSQATSLVFAAKEIRFSSESRAGSPVYDLNDRCVCPAGIPGKGTCAKDAAPTCDDPVSGADNSASDLFRSFALFDKVSLSDVEATKAIERGEFSILVRIDEYNGGANDGRVSVSLYSALRVDRDGGVADGGPVAPTFASDERWVADRTFLVGAPATAPKFFDSKAYVTDGTLVAAFPEIELAIVMARLGRVRFSSTDVHLIIQLGEGGSPKSAQLVGRVRMRSILDVGGILGWCPGMPQYIAVAEACKSADVNAASDDTGEAPCDALSSAFQFVLVPTQRPETFDVGTFAVSRCDADIACP